MVSRKKDKNISVQNPIMYRERFKSSLKYLIKFGEN